VQDLIELELRRADAPGDEAGYWSPFVQNILRVICVVTASATSPEINRLRSRLIEHRRQLSRPLHPQEARSVTAACVRDCEHYLQQTQHDHSAREAELADLVAILREAAARLVGDSVDFHATLLNGTTRLHALRELDDIRELKRQLTDEVASLEQAVSDKRRRDEEAIASLSKRIDALQSDLERAEAQATIDPLTQVANRGGFDRVLTRTVATARANGVALSLAMLDVDHFKAVNDTHGHQVGDRVLLCTAEWLRGAVRHTDFVARYGGEEFAVLLYDADLAQAEMRFERVVQAIAGRSYEYDDRGTPRVVRFTVSCGLAELMPQDSDQDLVERADQALYDAKRKGRNRVVCRRPSRLGRLLHLS
jgi:diguanylate cyclase